MKLLSLALLMSAALAAVAQGDAGFPEPEDLAAADLTQELPTANLRRFLADTNSTTAPPTTTPTTAPPTSRPPTSAPPTSSPSPSPTSSPVPTSATPNSPTPTSTGPATPTPAPSPSTPSPNGSNTPTPTKTPANNNNNNGSKNTDPATVASNSSSGSKSGGNNSTSKSSKTPAPSSSSGTNTEGDDSKMSGGTIAAIVGGIVAGVAILACVTMVLIRRKRETDDDPLSPFEMSMDKGYAGAHAGYGNNNNNAPDYAGAATNGAQRNAPGRTQQQMDLTDTPPAGAIAAGVAYSQFYDQQTSPGSINHTRQLSGDHKSTAAPVSEATNLWMSAMEPGANENDSYLSAKEGHDNESIHSSSRSNRNSYDLGYNDDQSSQISGASDLNSAKDFPDYEDESTRGSYEL